MTDHGTRLINLIRDHTTQQVGAGSLRRYRVNAVEVDGTLSLEDLATGEIDGESYIALAAPSPYAAGDFVLVGEVIGRGSNGSSTRVVIGKPTNNSAQTLVDSVSQATADTASTASTVTYANAITLALVLPAGTWTISAQGSVLLSHNVSQGSWRIEIDGDFSNAHTLAMTTEERFGAGHKVAGVVGGRTVNVRVQYRSFTAGTTSARNPAIAATAIRTA